ncbi:hypothetical protein H2O64_22455 [Kordia sp. YSTF-M3]|uniref:tRNA_anti-like n=1 Tax=Kordia aestuariivivens TaxID=2759037 RepID=A0ABR7QFZ1_9FLAO|nr:hypothetical protein [Kordia aestuariivivens]MBC8757449.1 hypothetical protein [Kordia aestuariivivens]
MSLSKRSKILIGLVIIIVVGAYAGYKYAYAPHTAINDMEVAFAGTSQNFLEKIKDNPESWTQGEKVIELTGKITGKDEKGISLNESIYFQLAEGTSTAELQEGQTIHIKGRIIGYDDLLEELKLDKAIIINK